ncbi:Tm-1-like ATP-binding domain-containing protein [Halostella sp. PRR32]|uniref:Tm-1-like ATP-binding domain-containing protein n=1 Tax=Halostella sp. PRR32 TaxID=3098147 RepID=UPI002B1E45EF|nr:Tm-1-like ATP-binding domain-containing protein [Halostella sp. PRR32]
MAIVIVGTLDTKGEEVAFAREVIEDHGADTHIVDAGVLGEPGFDPDTPADEVAAAAGTTLERHREERDRGKAIEAMGEGAAAVVTDLYEGGSLDGVLGLGGSGNTSIATAAMRALPVGVPKMMVSTMASGDTEPYVGISDVTMMYSVGDIEGLNQITRTVISNAALGLVGMATNNVDAAADDRPTVGISMFGVTTPCVKTAREYLEEQGYETVVFHATGSGGRAMEHLVAEGVIDGVLDVTTSELADELVGGILSAGPDRLSAAAEAGIPQVVSVGALDLVNFGPEETVPEEFRDRPLHVHNPHVTVVRTNADESAELGATVAEKLNAATGPTALALPTAGLSMLGVDGEPLHDPDADEALFDALRTSIDGDVDLVEMDTHVNDGEFALAMAQKLDEYMSDDEPEPAV